MGVWTWAHYFINILKKRNNYIPLNFEQTMIQSEIIALSTHALGIQMQETDLHLMV